MNIPDELLYEILYFLNNEEILNFKCINKKIYNLYNNIYFFNIIKNRKHPLVFNILQNLCSKCNIKNLMYRYPNFKDIINCQHLNYSIKNKS